MVYHLISLFAFLVLVLKEASASFGIPGTTQTISGYDTELGEDPICWTSTASDVGGELDTPFPNPLINDFKIQGEVTLLKSCPALNFMTAEAPIEFQRGERLRTGEIYDYKVTITLNLDSLGGYSFVSDEGPLIAVQILVCNLGAGFCSPFIHEEANARLAAKGIFESPDKGDNHGGSHTHSGYEFLRVPREDGPLYKLELTVPMQVNTAGDYYAIAAVQMYVGEAPEEPAAMRYDMANAFSLDQRLLTYQEPANIKVVPDGILIGSYVAIGLVSLVILFLLVETIKNRNHQVLQLTQGYFLIVFLVAALVMVASSFLFEPQNDLYCNARLPIILTSGQLLYAITLGRLWRINALISPLLMNTLRQKKGFTRRMMESLMSVVGLKIQPRKQNSKNLRKQISHWKLALVVALFTLPQAVIQVLAIVLQPQSLSYEFNDDESQGRVFCDSGFDTKSSLRSYGIWLFFLLVFLLLILAHTTSQLPSLFNESKVIYESTLFSVVLIILGFGVVIVTDDPTASPAARYLVSIGVTLSIAANASLRIMLPKLQMVWRNEKVVVSRLVSDHVKTTRENDARYANSGDTNCIVTGLTPQEREPSSSTLNSMTHSNSIDLADERARDSEKDYDQSHTSVFDFDADGLVNAEHSNSATTVEKETYRKSSSSEFARPPVPPGSSGRPKLLNEVSFNQRLVSLPSRRRSLSSKMLVQCDETPARRLVLKMVDLQEELAAVNDRIISGVAVSEEEWMSVRDLIGTLGSTFHDDVDFAWENKKDGPACTSKTNSGIGASKKNPGIGEVETEDIVEDDEEDP
jgi:cadmium resistance protein CadD (predicted permease)